MAKKNNTPKKLNLTNVNKAEKKIFTTSNLVVEVEKQDFIVKIDDVFRISKMDEAFKDFGNYMDLCEENGIEWNAGTLNLLVILENFTDIKFPDSILNKLQLMVKLTDIGATQKIFDSFNKEEMEKLNKRFEELNKTLPKILEEYGKINNQYMDENINKINDVIAKNSYNVSKVDKDKAKDDVKESEKTDIDG